MIPRYWPLGTVFRLLALYLLLVAYSGCYEYFYAEQLTTLFHDEYTAFDFGKLGIYKALCVLTPLAIVPIGTRLRSAGQLIAGAAAVFIFIPIPIVFVAMVPAAEFWGIYALLWLTYFIVCSMSSLSVRLRVPQVSEQGFQRFMVVFYILGALGFAYAITTNHFQISSLDKAHAAQADVTVKGLQAYLLIGFMGSFGGLLIALAVMLRKYYLLPLVVLGYFLCYGSLSERVAVLMPFWIAYIGLAGRWFFRDSVLRYMFTVMAPFVFFFSLGLILGLEDRTSTFYDVFTLANYRLYAVPAISFPVYYSYFATHPYTYWSHIGFIANFVHYPYGQPLALVLANAYEFGNDNASFIETDGLAAAGPLAMPFAAIVCGLVLMGINSCTRGLNRAFLAIVTAAASVTVIDTGLGPALVTNGLALMSVLLLFAPRDASWNLRYLQPKVRPVTQ